MVFVPSRMLSFMRDGIFLLFSRKNFGRKALWRRRFEVLLNFFEKILAKGALNSPILLEGKVREQLEDAKEEFGPERIKQVIEAVYNKRKFTLTKLDNPAAGEVLDFDFTKCEGTVSESILALASMEKVFRLYKSDKVTQTDYIRIDKKIDEFLSKYFNMYEYYAAHKAENADGPNYVDYDQMLEDEQSDDLTLLAIKRI